MSVFYDWSFKNFHFLSTQHELFRLTGVHQAAAEELNYAAELPSSIQSCREQHGQQAVRGRAMHKESDDPEKLLDV